MSEITAKISAKEACFIGIRALAYISQSPEDITRFLNVSGVALADVVRLSENMDFLGGVLDYILVDESLLVSFSTFEKIKPQRIEAARICLQGDSA